MAKIHVSRVIERLERSLVESPDSTFGGKTENVINDMRIILDFMGKQNLRNRSRLDYFISDIVDMVHEALNVKDDLTIYAKISPLQRWVGEVKMRLLNFGLSGAEMRSQSAGVEGDDGDELSVVGLEKDVKLLLSTTIFNEGQGFQTSAIEGMMGIGKTTLARQVYNHAKIRDRFECRAWVCVSSELSHKEVLVKLIQQVVHCEEVERDSLLRKMEYGDNRTLRKMLHQHLQGIRYLIVLDDWQEDMCLRSILKGLPHEDRGSRLLLTTRTYCIEESIYYDYEMTSLDSVSSWDLFLRTIFSGNKFTSEQKFPTNLEKKGRQMLRKCCGLPLAIKDVGRELAEKIRSGSEWEDLLELWRCMSNQDIVATNMAKALTLRMIRKLERSLVELPDSCNGKIQEVINELKIILDLLGEKKLGNGCRLDYFIGDIVDMVRDALDVKDDDLSIYDKIFSLNRSVVEVKMRALKLGAEVEMRSENLEVEGGDDDDNDVVGLEKDVELLLRGAVLNKEQCLQTSTIIGMVGIGKTTLARQVYNHADVVSRFECRVWVCISADLSYKEVLMKLIQRVVHYEEFQEELLLNRMEYEDNRCLRQMLQQHLQGKQYFIVLDNWQEGMCLNYILTCLPHEDNGSRLLLTNTTYSKEERTYYDYDYEMIPLDSVSSWKLFLKTISDGNKLTSEHKFPKHLEKKGREMLTTCWGVPLAIKDVARQLARKRRSGREWEDLLDELCKCRSNQDKVTTNIAKALTLWMIGKLERSMASWEHLLDESWQCKSNQDMVTTNMAKALTLWRIQNLERSMGEIPDSWNGKLGEVIDELRSILDFLGGNKLGKKTRLCYFINDIVEMVREALDVKNDEIFCLKRSVIDVKRRLFKLGIDEAKMRSETAGVEEGDDDNDAVGLDDEYVVGLVKDVELLLHRAIFDEEQGLKTSTITGMVGIGKTTLARQIFNHANVIGRFERRAWVCVSSDLSYKELLIKLIHKVIDCEEVERDLFLKKLENADNRSLKQMLRQYLQGMRYFIVLDDWPEEMCLRSILTGLPDEGKGSRLLLTGRSHYKEETIHYDHGMKYLDPMKSWELFIKTIFGGNKLKGEHKFPKHLERTGRKLLAQCGGLPLAIKYVGMQIARKRESGSKWEQCLESIDLGELLDLLEPFYQKLDPIVKSSFLHMAFFKENTIVRTEKLMILISAAGGKASQEEIRESLYQMIEDSIIEVEDNSIKRFRVNALQHKLSIKKAEEEIGFEMVRNNGNNRTSQSPRHRAIYCSRDKFKCSPDQDKHLVSLFFRGGGQLYASPSYWKSFELLEILDLEDFGIKILPKSIGTLKKLRYLGLRNNYIQELPYSLGCLKKLEVLDIALNCMVEVPDIIHELSSLRHLYMSNVIFQEPSLLFTPSLETLTYISANNLISGNWWLMMNKLHKLGIEEVDGDPKIRIPLALLSKMKQLEHLTLKGFRFRRMPSMGNLGNLCHLHTLKLDGRLASLPSVNNLPQNIVCLKFVNSCLDEDPMSELKKLPNLTHLKLRNAYTGQQMVILPDGFPNLQVICVEESWNLRNVQIGKGAMPRLEKLELKNCPYLETLPEEIGSMASLKELKMVTTKEIATKIRKSGLISNIKDVEMLELHLAREFKR